MFQQNTSNNFIHISLIFFLIIMAPFLIFGSESYNTGKNIVTLEKYYLITDHLKILKHNSSIFDKVNLYILENKKNIKIIFSSEDFEFNYSEINFDKILNENKIDFFSVENCTLYFNNNEKKIIYCYLGEINGNHCVVELVINEDLRDINKINNPNIEKIIAKIKEIIKLI